MNREVFNMAETEQMTRRESREAIFQLLYAREFFKDTESGEFYAYYSENAEKAYNDFVKTAFVGVCDNMGTIDAEIEASSVKWKVSRMAKVTRNILRLAVFELLYSEVPAKAVINEALELAKKYDDEQSPAFINGILNKIARDHGLLS